MSIFKKVAGAFYEFKEEDVIESALPNGYETTIDLPPEALEGNPFETISAAIEAAKSDKYKNFETQLLVLAKIEALRNNIPALYQSAMAASGISIEEIRENISNIESVAISQSRILLDAKQVKTKEKTDEIQVKILETEAKVVKNQEEISRLAVENQELSTEASKLRLEIQTLSSDSLKESVDINKFVEDNKIVLQKTLNELNTHLQ